MKPREWLRRLAYEWYWHDELGRATWACILLGIPILGIAAGTCYAIVVNQSVRTFVFSVGSVVAVVGGIRSLIYRYMLRLAKEEEALLRLAEVARQGRNSDETP